MEPEFTITFNGIFPVDHETLAKHYNYAYGREKLINATRYLFRTYGQSQETQAVAILALLAELIVLTRLNHRPDL